VVMRIGSWNVDARGDDRHRRLVTEQACEVYLHALAVARWGCCRDIAGSTSHPGGAMPLPSSEEPRCTRHFSSSRAPSSGVS
jgi:hypothetical protein